MARLAAALLLVIAVLAVPSPAAQRRTGQALLDTIVGFDTEIRLPATPSTMGAALASVAKSTGALVGFEVAMDHDDPHVSDRWAWSPRGLTLSQALDQIVALDPRYEWREHRGVIHVRPKAAFDDPRHFLQTRVGRFELKDALPLHATFEVHRVYLPHCRIVHPIYTDEREAFLSEEHPSMRKRVTVSLASVTVIEILDAVVKAHGELFWNLQYVLPPDGRKPESAQYEHAVFSFAYKPAVGGWWRMCN